MSAVFSGLLFNNHLKVSLLELSSTNEAKPLCRNCVPEKLAMDCLEIFLQYASLLNTVNTAIVS
jgi:hypothetical protein